MVLKSKGGQALIESLIALPLFLLTTVLFISFLYEQYWTQTIEHLMNEGLICEYIRNQNSCLNETNEKIHQKMWGGKVFIESTHKHVWTATFYLNEGIKWKTLTIKRNPENQKF